jgi:1-deoxy-D-xylulose 5-phosphate reductoisomerase
VAVDAFLEKRIRLLQVADVIEEVLDALPDFGAMRSMDTIRAADAWARTRATRQTQGAALR